MVEALALRRGEGPKHGGSQHSVVAELNAKLPTFSSQLKAEYQKLAEERDAFLLDQAAQLKSGSDKAAKLLGKQAAQAKGELSELQKTAPKFLKEGSPPEVSDLGKEALLDIERVKTLGNPQVCTRCHWQSSCPSCDVWKCTRYHFSSSLPLSGLADSLCEGEKIPAEALQCLSQFQFVACWKGRSNCSLSFSRSY